MAYGVDQFPDPPEIPEGHYEYEDGEHVFVRDFDDDGNSMQEEL